MADPQTAADPAAEETIRDPELVAAEAEARAEERQLQAEAAPEPDPPTISLPKERLDQVLRRLDEERSRRLMLEGENGMLRAAHAPPPPEPPVDPRAERLRQIDAELDHLYAQYDRGGVALQDLRQAERRLNREAVEVSAMRAADPAARRGDDPYVADQTHLIEAGNPWLVNVPGAVLHDFMPMAARLCQASGIALRVGDPTADLAMRRALITVLKEHGYDRRYGAPGPEADGPRPGQRLATGGLTPRQIRDKMALAERAAPSPARAGVVPRDLSVTASDVERMSEDEILSLPTDIQERIAASRA